MFADFKMGEISLVDILEREEEVYLLNESLSLENHMKLIHTEMITYSYLGKEYDNYILFFRSLTNPDYEKKFIIDDLGKKVLLFRRDLNESFAKYTNTVIDGKSVSLYFPNLVHTVPDDGLMESLSKEKENEVQS